MGGGREGVVAKWPSAGAPVGHRSAEVTAVGAVATQTGQGPFSGEWLKRPTDWRAAQEEGEMKSTNRSGT